MDKHLAKLASLSLLSLAGCADPSSVQPASATAPLPPATYHCLLPTEQRMLVAELFFGRNINKREPLTETEWGSFAAQVVTPNFPDGFTVFDGDGQWQNPQTGKIAHEPTKILLVAAKRSPDLAGRLTAVIDAYKTRFHQESVGIVTRDSCGNFN